MAQVVPFVRVTRLDTNVVMGTSDNIIAWRIERGLDGLETLDVTLAFTDTSISGPDAVGAIISAGGGVSGGVGATPIPCLLEFSLDGGTSYDARKMVEHPTTVVDSTNGPYVREGPGPGLFTGYAVTLIDHLTLHGVSLSDLLTVDPSIPTYFTFPANTGIGNPELKQRLKGYGATTPGNPAWAGQSQMAFTFVVDASVGSLSLDVDEFSSPIDKAIAAAVSAVVGANPTAGSTGMRAHYVVDSSDAALNLGGTDRTVVVGAVGTSAHCMFNDQATGSDIKVFEPFAREVQLEDLDGQETMVGGYTPHGLPEGATITSMVTIHNPTTHSAAWYNSLLMVAAHDSNGIGGIFYYHEGSFYRYSQQLTASWLAYDEANGKIYAGTTDGVYVTDDTLPTALVPYSNWTKVGGLSAPIRKVIVDTGAVVALVGEGGNSTNVHGVYIYPVIGTDTSGVTHGYDGWTALLTSKTIIDCAYYAADDELHTIDSNDPIHVSVYRSLTAGTPTVVGKPFTAGNDAMLGLDVIQGGSAVRTSAGSAGLYYLASGQTAGSVVLSSLNTSGLTDPNGQPVMVNRVVPFYDGSLSIAGEGVGLFACTDAGVFRCAGHASPVWKAPSPDSGIYDQNIAVLAAGREQWLQAASKPATRIYAATSATLYVSHSDGMIYDDELRANLDLNRHFMAAAQSIIVSGVHPYVPFPDYDVDGVCTSNPSGGTGGQPGTIATGLAGDYALPANQVWLRPLNEHNQRTYRLTDFGSHAPYWGTHPGEVAEIVGGSANDDLNASRKLAYVHARRLLEYSRVQTILTLESSFTDDASPLRTLRPTHMTHVTLHQTRYGMVYSGATFYALSCAMEQRRDDPVIYVEAQVAALLRSRPPTEDELAESQGYAGSKQHRYRKQ